jgi:hypothetical protein
MEFVNDLNEIEQNDFQNVSLLNPNDPICNCEPMISLGKHTVKQLEQALIREKLLQQNTLEAKIIRWFCWNDFAPPNNPKPRKNDETFQKHEKAKQQILKLWGKIVQIKSQIQTQEQIDETNVEPVYFYLMSFEATAYFKNETKNDVNKQIIVIQPSQETYARICISKGFKLLGQRMFALMLRINSIKDAEEAEQMMKQQYTNITDQYKKQQIQKEIEEMWRRFLT